MFFIIFSILILKLKLFQFISSSNKKRIKSIRFSSSSKKSLSLLDFNGNSNNGNKKSAFINQRENIKSAFSSHRNSKL